MMDPTTEDYFLPSYIIDDNPQRQKRRSLSRRRRRRPRRRGRQEEEGGEQRLQTRKSSAVSASSYPLCLIFLVMSSWRHSHALVSRHHSSSSPFTPISSSQPLQLPPSSSRLQMVASARSRSRSNSNSKSSSSNGDTGKKIVQLGRAGKTDEALSLYQNIKRPTIRHLNSAIDACARARPPRLLTAFKIFHGSFGEGGQQQQTQRQKQEEEKTTGTVADNSNGSNKNLRPNVFTFGALMNACNRARDGSRAVQLLGMMESTYNVVPNEVVYSAAISACARSKPPQTKQALQLLKEAVEERRLPMSVVGFNACISACAQASDYENAISLVARMEDASQHRSSSGRSGNGRNTADDDDDGDRTNLDGDDDSSSETKFLIPEPDEVTYGTVLAACERGQQWRTLLKYAQSMEERGLVLDGLALTSCLHACAELGLSKNALVFLEKMKSIDPVAPYTAKFERDGARKQLLGPDPVAYRCAITACARGGEWEEGIRLLQECKSITGTPPNVVAYTASITGCEYAGEWKTAFILLDRMRKEGVEPNEMTMGAVIGACATACAKSTAQTFEFDNLDDDDNDTPLPQQKALQLLKILKNDPSTVNPNIQIYNACIRTCAEARDVHGAFELLKEIKDAGLDRTQVTYGSLMTACERVGDVKKVNRVFELMNDDNMKPNEVIYGAAISCCRKANDPQRALWLLKKMIQEKLLPNTATLNTVLIAQTDSKSKTDSSRVLQLYKLMNSKYVAQNGRPNRQTYNILVNFFASTMQPAMAERFIDKMREVGFKPDVDLFTATVTAYERTQQPLKAVKMMKRMEEVGYDFYSVKVLNSAVKKAVGLVNAVGQSFTSPTDIYNENDYSDLDDEYMPDDDFIS
eukprot:CAMPEP_0113493024 /NCGR_PEP_ID=MMETSP0014_2-20120614/28377_1 /TAXON_ID=2857 /ORGANISM="Nitzschia sp." /LENGTH=865 /DNA_ID=CAMNT_0000386871 /DNA_START=122 /DNA_END=2719 /DNA_ORIENTATION=+ /assembly_acc=CAM_ASM_000159